MFTALGIGLLTLYIGIGLVIVIIMINIDFKTYEERKHFINNEAGQIAMGVLLWPLLLLVLLCYGFKELILFFCKE